MDKYKNLLEIEKILCEFTYRYLKEKKVIDIYKFKSLINKNIVLNDGIIIDVLNLICDTLNISMISLIDEIKISKYYTINDMPSLIQMIKDTCSTVSFLTEPIDVLLYWDGTQRGFRYYKKYNKIIFDKLKLSHIIDDLLLNN